MHGIYITANAVASTALGDKIKGWAWNKLSPYPGSPKNEFIFDRRRLLIDVDPDRPKDVAATDEEKKLAADRATEIVAFLTSKGWPEPVLIDSGNGIQLLYKIGLPVASPLVRQVLYALHKRFTGSGVVIDKAVSAAKTLMRLPGTMNCKGKSTKARPHRRASLLSAPTKLTLVTEELLKTVLAPAAEPKAKASKPVAAAIVQVERYIDVIPAAVKTASDGSSKALLVARAIVVGFNIKWDSDEAWALLKRWNRALHASLEHRQRRPE